MRILLVINGTDFGGSESALAQIAGVLDHRGHEVHVLSLKIPGRIGQRMIDSGIPVHTLGMTESVSIGSMLAAVVGLWGWLRGNPVDVVLSFLPRANIVSRLANRLTSRSRPHFSAERSTDFNRAALVCRLNRWTTRWTDLVFAVSPEVKEVLVARDQLPREKIDILQNGLDLAEADGQPRTDLRGELDLSCEEFLFCAVGRLVPVKGYRYLLRALGSLSAVGRPHLVIVGEGPEEFSIRKTAEKLNISDYVHLLGFRRDVLGILKDADAFVLPSLQEGVPVVLLEAMACSLPIIATDVGGVGDLVVDEETAILVPPAEDWTTAPRERSSAATNVEMQGISALTTAMARLVEDSGLRQRMGAAGRRRLEEVFSIDRVVDRLEAHFAQVAEARATR